MRNRGKTPNPMMNENISSRSNTSSRRNRIKELFVVIFITMLLCLVMMTMTPPTVELQSDIYTLANNQSYGFFKDITTDNWNRLREISSKNVRHLTNDNPSIYTDVRGQRNADEKSSTPTAWFQSHYEPDFGCMFKKRVGGNGNGDGPKWVCTKSSPLSLLISKFPRLQVAGQL